MFEFEMGKMLKDDDNRDFPQEYSYGNVFDYNEIKECFNSLGFYKMLKATVA